MKRLITSGFGDSRVRIDRWTVGPINPMTGAAMRAGEPGAGADDFLYGVADGLPDPGVYREVRLLMDEFLNAFRKHPDFRSGS